MEVSEVSDVAKKALRTMLRQVLEEGVRGVPHREVPALLVTLACYVIEGAARLRELNATEVLAIASATRGEFSACVEQLTGMRDGGAN